MMKAMKLVEMGLVPDALCLCLGRNMKYSGGFWPEGVEDLDSSEVAMLRLTCERARLEDGMDILEHWRVNGRHYGRTAHAWLDNLDRNRDMAMPLLESTYGKDQARKWLEYWRIFFMPARNSGPSARGRNGWFPIPFSKRNPRPFPR